ncbi:MAG: efflux RND transporter periplasmic adaptor subunit [Halofilum sp. (in: g-proteobacteria)]|nr:efflux RND transporter periplasmic adaptor subunit [Halofilum sp. (in: g-proteobacteria)]
MARQLRLLLPLLLLMPAAAVGEQAPLPVTARPAGELFVAIERSAPATAIALQRTEVPARLAAPVERFLVEVGDRVAGGDPLARLECVDATDARDAAAARLREARALARLSGLQLERVRRLRARDAVAAEELDRAEAEHSARLESVAAREAELARARRDVDRCEVSAPVAGMVAARHRAVGDFVQPGTPLLSLVAVDAIEVRATAPAESAASLLEATAIAFHSGDRRYPVDRPRRTGVIDPATRTEEIRLAFSGPRPRPGAAGRVHWRSSRTAVPADLLVRRDGRLGVFLVDAGRARFRPLDGAVEGRPAPADLDPGVRIIVDGRHAATDGAAIELVE